LSWSKSRRGTNKRNLQTLDPRKRSALGNSMRKELVLLLMFEAGLLIGEFYFQSVSYRFIPPAPQPLVIHAAAPTSSVTVTTLPNGHNFYNVSVSDSYIITDSLSAVYYNAANAARAQALARISLTLDAFHVMELLTFLVWSSLVFRIITIRRPSVPYPSWVLATRRPIGYLAPVR